MRRLPCHMRGELATKLAHLPLSSLPPSSVVRHHAVCCGARPSFATHFATPLFGVVQLHTTGSYKIKQEIHRFYRELRNPNGLDRDKLEALKQMKARWWFTKGSKACVKGAATLAGVDVAWH